MKRTSSSMAVTKLGVVVLAGALWVLPGGSTVVLGAAATCGDQYCDREFGGENCSNCSDDCECICGDDVCTGTWPTLETCGSCYEDCWSSCVCGDSQCTYPAEGGGYGSGQECANSGFEHCETCVTDCGTCSALLCYLEFDNACHAQSGECGPCDDSFNKCMDGDEDFWCNEEGKCIYIG